jgi:hypothetical protein
MTDLEFVELAEWIIGHWQTATVWGPDRRVKFAADFADLDYGWAMEAAKDAFAEGRRYAPSPSELMVKVARPVGGWLGRPDPLTCRHLNWAILEYETEREDGRRFGVCAACLMERWADPARGEMLNSIEQEARAKERSADRIIPPGDDWEGRRDLE